MFKVLETKTLTRPLKHPLAIVFNYPALDFGFTSWMSPAHLRVLRAEHKKSSSHVAGLSMQKDHFSHESPLAVINNSQDVEGGTQIARRKSWQDSIPFTSAGKQPRIKKRHSVLFKSPIKEVPSDTPFNDLAVSRLHEIEVLLVHIFRSILVSQTWRRQDNWRMSRRPKRRTAGSHSKRVLR